MATGSPIDSQLGLKAETTYGTPVTVDRFFEYDEASLVWEPNWREPTGLRAGRRFKRYSRLAMTRSAASGSISLQHSTRDMGLLWKMALMSSVSAPTTLVAPATRQIHIPSDTITSATLQLGIPEPQSTTVRAHTFAGVVCTGWEASVDDGETLNLSMDLDARSEATATALATASYTAGANVFAFQNVSNFKTGGTATTTTGLISVASGVAVPGVVTAWSISGSNALALERYGLGNAGLKNAPRINDYPTYTGSLTAEYDRTTWYDPFKAGTAFAMQLDFVGAAIAASGSSDTVSFIAPKMVVKSAGPTISGPELVSQTVEFEIYDDEVNAPLQVVLISADATTPL
jgi:hypothetical protein